MKATILWRRAAFLMAGVLLFAFGASRMLSQPVGSIAIKIQARSDALQMVGAE